VSAQESLPGSHRYLQAPTGGGPRLSNGWGPVTAAYGLSLFKQISPKQKHIEQMGSQEAAIRVSQPHGRKGLHIGNGEFGNTTDRGYCP